MDWAKRQGGLRRRRGLFFRTVPPVSRNGQSVKPAARQVLDMIGWGGRDRTYECRNQNPVPYHLATPQLKPSRPKPCCGEAYSEWRVQRAPYFGAMSRNRATATQVIVAA
jgi:hypothetical protein